MPKITELLPKLDEEAQKERDMFSGDLERQFFIELMGAGNVDDLLEMYDPAPHNEKWDAERQKVPENINVIVRERLAVAFMYAGKQCAHKRYKTTELRSHVMGRMRMNWNLNQHTQTRYQYEMDRAKQR